MRKRGISPVISTVIITATLLVILVVASFFAINLLEIQIQNSEFEQAKTAMLLLDKTIIDVALRPGAVSSVQFNQRSGGIGLYEGGTISITVINASSSNIIISVPQITSHVIKYRGGSMVSAAEATLTNSGGLIIDNPSKSLGLVRIEAGNGVWIILDYNRVRVTVGQLTDLGILDIYMICLEKGIFGGSGTVSVRVQNMGMNVDTATISVGSNEVTLRVHVTIGSVEGESDYTFRGVNSIKVRVAIVRIRVSIV